MAVLLLGVSKGGLGLRIVLLKHEQRLNWKPSRSCCHPRPLESWQSIEVHFWQYQRLYRNTADARVLIAFSQGNPLFVRVHKSLKRPNSTHSMVEPDQRTFLRSIPWSLELSTWDQWAAPSEPISFVSFGGAWNDLEKELILIMMVEKTKGNLEKGVSKTYGFKAFQISRKLLCQSHFL